MSTQEPSLKPQSPDVAIWVLVILIAGISFLIGSTFWFAANFTWYCIINKVDGGQLTGILAIAIMVIWQLFRYLNNLVEALLRQIIARYFSAESVGKLKETIKVPMLRSDESGTIKTSGFLMEIVHELIGKFKK